MLIDAIRGHMFVNYSYENGRLVIAESGHKQNGKEVRRAYAQWVRETFQEEVSFLEEKFMKPLFVEEVPYKDVVSLTPPYIPMFLAAGLLDHRQWFDVMMKAPDDAELINYFVDDKDFKPLVLKSYDILWGTQCK